MTDLSPNCTISEWEAWAKSHTVSLGEDRAITVRIDLDVVHGARLHMVPVVRVGSGGAVFSDSRVMRSSLRRSLAILDTIEDLFATVAHVRVWEDGECPCGSCSGRGVTYASGPECGVCGGKGVR